MSKKKKTTKKTTKKKSKAKEETENKLPTGTVKAIKTAEENYEKTRAFQQKFDYSEPMTVYKKNKLECPLCGYDQEPRGIIIWMDPKTGESFMNLRTVCYVGCENRDNVYQLEKVEKDAEEIFGFDY